MLQALRQSSKSLFMKILLAIIASTFVVFFGVSGNIGTGLFSNPNTLVEVGDTAYGQSTVVRRYNRLANFYAERLGGHHAITPEMQQQILNQAVEAMVVEGLFAEAAEDIGLTAGDQLVAQQIRNEPGFQAGGEFNRLAFENFLLQTGQSEAEFAELLRQRIVIDEQYFGSLFAGLTAPEILVEYLYRYQQEERSAELVLIDASAIEDVGAPGPDALAAYYEENREAFRVPPLRSGTVLEVSIDELAATIDITDDELAAAYEERKAQYTVPESREIEQALFASRDLAQQAFDRVAGGSTFDEAVRAILDRAPASIGEVRREELLEVHASPAFATPVGEVSEPFETPLGWMLVHVVARQGGTMPPLDEIADELREDMQRDRANELLFEYIDDIDDAVAGGASLEEVAQMFELPAVTIEPVDQNGQNAAGEPVPELPGDPDVLTELFALEPGQVSTYIQTASDRFYFVEVLEAFESRVPPLDEIEARVRAAWRTDRQFARARERADEIAAALAEGASAADIERRFGHELLAPGPFTRDGGLTGLPANLVEDVFAADEGDVVTSESEVRVIVARVTDVEVPSEVEDQDMWSDVLRQFDAALAQDLQSQLAAGLRDEIDVKVDRGGLEQAFFGQ